MQKKSSDFDFATATDENIARNLKRARDQRALSQAELARRVTELGVGGFHQTTIARIESGTRSLRAAEAIAVCQVLAISLESLAASESADQLRGAIDDASMRAKAFDNAAAELISARRVLAQLLDTLFASVPDGREVSASELLEASHALELQFAAENVLSDSDPMRRLAQIYRAEVDAASRKYPDVVDATHFAALVESMEELLGQIEGRSHGEHQTEA